MCLLASFGDLIKSIVICFPNFVELGNEIPNSTEFSKGIDYNTIS